MLPHVINYIGNLSPTMFLILASAASCLIAFVVWLVTGKLGEWYANVTVKELPWENLKKDEAYLRDIKKLSKKSIWR